MKKILAAALAALIMTGNATLTIADQPSQEADLPLGTVSVVPAALSSKDRAESLIRAYAAEYGVSSALMEEIVGCETGNTYDPSIQSFQEGDGPNGRENSWGLVQIDLDYWPSVTREEAQDPDFALAFLAHKLYTGNAGLWSCYRIVSEHKK